MTDSEIRQYIEDHISKEIEGLRAAMCRELDDAINDLRIELDQAIDYVRSEIDNG